MIDYTAAYADLYTIGATDSGVLAQLGSGGLMPTRRLLSSTAGRVLPWLVWSAGPVDGQRGEMTNLTAAWWAYIAPTADERKLYDIATAVASAYADVFSVAWGRVTVGALGQPFIDEKLNNLQGLRIPLVGRRLG